MGKGNFEGILKSIWQHEKTRKLFRKLQAALNLMEFGGLMSVWVPSKAATGLTPPPKIATDWDVVNDPVEVERQIIEQSKKHFWHAHRTPFTTPPLNGIDSTAHLLAKEILQSGLPP